MMNLPSSSAVSSESWSSARSFPSSSTTSSLQDQKKSVVVEQKPQPRDQVPAKSSATHQQQSKQKVGRRENIFCAQEVIDALLHLEPNDSFATLQHELDRILSLSFNETTKPSLLPIDLQYGQDVLVAYARFFHSVFHASSTTEDHSFQETAVIHFAKNVWKKKTWLQRWITGLDPTTRFPVQGWKPSQWLEEKKCGISKMMKVFARFFFVHYFPEPCKSLVESNSSLWKSRSFPLCDLGFLLFLAVVYQKAKSQSSFSSSFSSLLPAFVVLLKTLCFPWLYADVLDSEKIQYCGRYSVPYPFLLEDHHPSQSKSNGNDPSERINMAVTFLRDHGTFQNWQELWRYVTGMLQENQNTKPIFDTISFYYPMIIKSLEKDMFQSKNKLCIFLASVDHQYQKWKDHPDDFLAPPFFLPLNHAETVTRLDRLLFGVWFSLVDHAKPYSRIAYYFDQGIRTPTGIPNRQPQETYTEKYETWLGDIFSLCPSSSQGTVAASLARERQKIISLAKQWDKEKSEEASYRDVFCLWIRYFYESWNQRYPSQKGHRRPLLFFLRAVHGFLEKKYFWSSLQVISLDLSSPRWGNYVDDIMSPWNSLILHPNETTLAALTGGPQQQYRTPILPSLALQTANLFVSNPSPLSLTSFTDSLLTAQLVDVYYNADVPQQDCILTGFQACVTSTAYPHTSIYIYIVIKRQRESSSSTKKERRRSGLLYLFLSTLEDDPQVHKTAPLMNLSTFVSEKCMSSEPGSFPFGVFAMKIDLYVGTYLVIESFGDEKSPSSKKLKQYISTYAKHLSIQSLLPLLQKATQIRSNIQTNVPKKLEKWKIRSVVNFLRTKIVNAFPSVPSSITSWNSIIDLLLSFEALIRNLFRIVYHVLGDPVVRRPPSQIPILSEKHFDKYPPIGEFSVLRKKNQPTSSSFFTVSPMQWYQKQGYTSLFCFRMQCMTSSPSSATAVPKSTLYIFLRTSLAKEIELLPLGTTRKKYLLQLSYAVRRTLPIDNADLERLYENDTFSIPIDLNYCPKEGEQLSSEERQAFKKQQQKKRRKQDKGNDPQEQLQNLPTPLPQAGLKDGNQQSTQKAPELFPSIPIDLSYPGHKGGAPSSWFEDSVATYLEASYQEYQTFDNQWTKEEFSGSSEEDTTATKQKKMQRFFKERMSSLLHSHPWGIFSMIYRITKIVRTDPLSSLHLFELLHEIIFLVPYWVTLFCHTKEMNTLLSDAQGYRLRPGIHKKMFLFRSYEQNKHKDAIRLILQMFTPSLLLPLTRLGSSIDTPFSYIAYLLHHLGGRDLYGLLTFLVYTGVIVLVGLHS